MKKSAFVLSLVFAFLCMAIAPQHVMAQKEKLKADKFATITIAVINSYRPFHIAFVRYYNADGDLLLNTSEEFRVEISKSERHKTGSVRKTIPVYNDAQKIVVSVSKCTNMHENEFLVSDFEASNNEATFVFRGEFDEPVRVKFIGVQPDKPATFNISGQNTSVIFYADYNNVEKILEDEADLSDLRVEGDRTALYEYKVTGTERKEDPVTRSKVLEVTVEYVDKSLEAANNTQNQQTNKKGEKKKKKKKKE
ncbi:MAG: hypothetical protein EAZ57_01035 [Cytophagales bacterium]|nr:MAG: hypothetical protein EAZ67_00095 [Cytophagales bacterium]TAF62369.1 MAG: hypothetical protein EAZ57_01035 [Cytophagales bacterium]